MIFSSLEPDNWDSINAGELRNFLESNTGILTLRWLIHQSPDLLDGSDVNKSLVASGQVKGYDAAINNLFSLTKVQPAEVTLAEAYPAIDDDSKWNDSKPKPS